MQPEDEKIDARDQRDGGWSWSQNDIYTVFLPIIGREATHLYQVMTYLIPERIRNPNFDLTVRKIAEVAMMSKSNVDRQLKVLHRVGLMPRVSDDPPLFVLADLRKLAKLGAAELRRRLVPQGDNGDEGGGSDPGSEGGPGWPQGGANGGDAHPNGSTPQEMVPEGPEGSGGGLVPQGDKEASLGPVDGNLRKTTIADLILSQKQGGLVPQNEVFVPPQGHPLILNLSRKETTTPLPPASGGSAPSTVPANAKPTDNGQNLPHEGQEPETVAELREAVAKVLRECGLSGRRHAAVIERAMCAEAAMTDERPDWNAIAERMCAAREEYSRLGRQGLLRIGPYRLERFFGEAIWRETGLWAIDEKRFEQQRRRF